MYTLYYSPGACSIVTQVVLHELEQDVTIIDVNNMADFKSINPVQTVPVLVDGDKTLREGVAILLHLLNKHPNQLLAASGDARQQGIQDVLFANATMHPAYGTLFFVAKTITDDEVKQTAFNAAAEHINHLWEVVESELEGKTFLGGDEPSAADIMLAVYAIWGAYFPVDITFGAKTAAMLSAVQAMSNFVRTIEAQKAKTAA